MSELPFPAVTPAPPSSFTAWYRFSGRGRWQQGPTRDDERSCWDALWEVIRQAGSPPHCDCCVLPSGKSPNAGKRGR
jgi:hypothetical protein